MAPVYVLTPLSVKVPEPSLVKLPVPVVIVPLTTTSPLPPNVTPILVEVIALAPLKVNTSASLWILLADKAVIVPAQLLFPLILRSTPKELTPAPSKRKAKEPTDIPPCN